MYCPGDKRFHITRSLILEQKFKSQDGQVTTNIIIYGVVLGLQLSAGEKS